MHIEYISNGLGAPSMYMLLLAIEGRIPATVSISADTGSENDRLLNSGARTTNADYIRDVVEPLAREGGIEVAFVRADDKHGNAMPSLLDHTAQMIQQGKITHIKMPLFGSNGGRLRQACTQRWKVMAIRQELRRRGATSARGAHGLHRGEVHRMKGHSGRVEAGYYTLTDFDVKWVSHYYPLIDIGLFRANIQEEMDRRGIPWIVSSECDMCPHKDISRWLRTDPAVISRVAELEAGLAGQFFFTDRRIPLRDAIAQMQQQPEDYQTQIDFGCDNGAVCGV